MTVATITGVSALRQRFAAAGDAKPLKESLRREAEAIAEEARAVAPGDLRRSVEVRDTSSGSRIAYEVGTSDPAGHFLEFGTARRPASPWLWPIFLRRLPGVKHQLRKILMAPSKRQAGAV